MSNKLFIFGMAVTCLCGFSTKGFATTNSFKAPAGTDTAKFLMQKTSMMRAKF